MKTIKRKLQIHNKSELENDYLSKLRGGSAQNPCYSGCQNCAGVTNAMNKDISASNKS